MTRSSNFVDNQSTTTLRLVTIALLGAIFFVCSTASAEIYAVGQTAEPRAQNREATVRQDATATTVSSPAISATAYQFGWRQLPVENTAYILEWDITAIEGGFQVSILDEEANSWFARTEPNRQRGELLVTPGHSSLGIILHAFDREASPTTLQVNHLVWRPAEWSEGQWAAIGKGHDRYSGSPPLLFSSWEFIFVFLPLVLLVYRRLRGTRWPIALLLITSLLWYSAWDWRLLPMLLGSVVLNWLLAMALDRWRSKLLLAITVAINLLPLVYFKYLVFGFESVGQNPSDWILPDFIPTLLPLGISFYTFQQIAYAVDVFKGATPERSFNRYAFFVTFFPQLVAGPIVHHQQLLPQIDTRPDRQRLMLFGVVYFLIGLGKKVLIADTIGPAIEPFFELGGTTGAIESMAAIVGYSVQLYFDFSGYSDMAMGLAAMFGFVLPINFDSPYKATSIVDFWRRWHITLSAFLRDYIYIPLGGNRHGDARRYTNLMLTMLLGGLWHGAGWAFIVWGGLHGGALALQHVVSTRFPKLRLGPAAAPLTILFVFLLWVPFRAERLDVTLEIFGALGSWSGHIDLVPGLTIIAGLIIATMLPNSHAIVAHLETRFRSIRPWLYGLSKRVGLYLLILATSLSSILVSYRMGLDSYVSAVLDTGTETGVRKDASTLRAAINNTFALSGSEHKWVVAGPSFSMYPDRIFLDMPGHTIRSGSIGIGGQAAANWIRPVATALHRDDVEVMFLLISPVSFGRFTLAKGEPYPEEADLWAMPADLQNWAPLRVAPITANTSLISAITDNAGGLDQIKMQYRQILSWISNLAGLGPDPPEYEIQHATTQNMTLASLEQTAAEFQHLRSQSEDSPTGVADPENGKNTKFSWPTREIVQDLQSDGRMFSIIQHIANMARENGTRLILVETPTPSHAQAPDIYPAGFFEHYQDAIQNAAAAAQLEYLDYSRLLPWDGRAMADFIHPTSKCRSLLHKELLRHAASTHRDAP